MEGVRFPTQRGVVQVHNATQEGRALSYRAADLVVEEKTLEDALTRLWPNVPRQIHAERGGYRAEVIFAGHPFWGSASSYGLAELTPTAGGVPAFHVWAWATVDRPTGLLSENAAIQIAGEYETCWRQAPVMPPATSPLPVTFWNGTLAYVVTMGDNQNQQCDSDGQPVLVDAVTGKVLGHHWRCGRLRDGPARDVDATLRY